MEDGKYMCCLCYLVMQDIRSASRGGLGYVEWCLPVCDVSNSAMICPVCSLWPMAVCFLWGNEANLNVDVRLRLRVGVLKRVVGNKSACSSY